MHGSTFFLINLKLAKSLTISCVVISVCGCYVDNLQIWHILIKKYINTLVDISKMSPDLEIIMMVASILEKSKLIVCGVTVSGVNVFSGNTEPLVTCIIIHLFNGYAY